MKQSSITLKIAGISVGFRINNAAMLSRVQRRYAGYEDAKAKKVLTLECCFSRIGLKGGNLPRVRVKDGITFIHRRDLLCRWKGDSGDVRMYPSIYAFDACLRSLYATLLPAYKGLLLHASAVAGKGRALVFPGKSGAGKTTISLLSGMNILNDEIVALRLDRHGRGKVHGTPFWGEMGTGPVFSRGYPASALMFIEKGTECRTEPLGMAEGLSRMLKCVCYFSRDPSGAAEVMASAVSIAGAVPMMMFSFSLGDVGRELKKLI